MRSQIRFVTPDDFASIVTIAENGRYSPWLAPVLRTIFATGCRPAEVVGARFRQGRELEEGRGSRISRRKAHHGLRARDVQPNHRLYVEGKHTTPTGRTLDLKPRVVLCADPDVWDMLRKRADAATSRDANLFLPRSRDGVAALGTQIRKLQPALAPHLREFSPRWLRHGHAIAAIRAGVDLVSIQRQLGHEDLSTTAIYLRYAGLDDTRYLAAFGGRLTHEVEPRDCPSCGFAWKVDKRTGALSLDARLGAAMRRKVVA
jgi:integrase